MAKGIRDLRKADLKEGDKSRQKQFEVFKVKEEGEELVASIWRWDDGKDAGDRKGKSLEGKPRTRRGG